MADTPSNINPRKFLVLAGYYLFGRHRYSKGQTFTAFGDLAAGHPHKLKEVTGQQSAVPTSEARRPVTRPVPGGNTVGGQPPLPTRTIPRVPVGGGLMEIPEPPPVSPSDGEKEE